MGVQYVDGEVINFQYKTQYFIEGDGQKQRQDLKVCDVRYQLIISLNLTALYMLSANINDSKISIIRTLIFQNTR